jgi:electron transport complex protein RnfG
MMGIALDGTVEAISILSISETPGLGMRAAEVIASQIEEINVDYFEYTKTGAMTANQIDAISGATITTNAITNGLNAGISYFDYLIGGGDDE